MCGQGPRCARPSRSRCRRGFHVQSNKPRDASLIPTELTVDGPSGIQVEELVFPIAVDFPQEGLDQPLLVFEREFTIGVRLSLPANLPPGELVVPGAPPLSGLRREDVLRAEQRTGVVDAEGGAGRNDGGRAAR